MDQVNWNRIMLSLFILVVADLVVLIFFGIGTAVLIIGILHLIITFGSFNLQFGRWLLGLNNVNSGITGLKGSVLTMMRIFLVVDNIIFIGLAIFLFIMGLNYSLLEVLGHLIH